MVLQVPRVNSSRVLSLAEGHSQDYNENNSTDVRDIIGNNLSEIEDWQLFSDGVDTITDGSDNIEVEEEDFRCVVCFEDKPLITIWPCGHTSMCLACLDRIISSNNICPLCRAEIRVIDDG